MFRLVQSVLLLASVAASAQSVPILVSPPGILYPPIAKAAHVSGDVTVTFSINPDGTTTAVDGVSGPVMLRNTVAERIQHWIFRTPLPIGSSVDFEAKYSFKFTTDEDPDYEGSLDLPPGIFFPTRSDVGTSPAGTVIGEVSSASGSQIDLSATEPSRSVDLCPQDSNKTPPNKTDLNDYVEVLHDAGAQDLPGYKARLYRNGRITWHGYRNVTTIGDSEGLLNASAADAVISRFQGERFWSSCSAPLPNMDDESLRKTEEEEDEAAGAYLTVNIGGIVKTTRDNDLDDWIIDRSADLHRWRHIDAASEPYSNMYEDIQLPKPDMTLLIRATYHFNPYTGAQTFSYLDRLLKRGESVDAADASGWTPLMYASYLDSHLAEQKDGDPIKLLLDAHADPNRASLHGDTALMFAAYRGALLQPLLDHGADINAHNAEGVTTLMLLAQAATDIGELKEALAAKANPNAQDNHGRTALDYLIAASSHRPIVAFPKPKSESITVDIHTPPYPDTSSKYFLDARSLLQRAMAPKATHHTL